MIFLHFRETNHIAGSCLSIGKVGVYSKEQGKKKKIDKVNIIPKKYSCIPLAFSWNM